MLGHRELTMRDYVGILKRRIWLILASTLLILGLSIGYSYTLHPQFVSQTLVLIEQQKVPEDYVKPVVNEDLNARLASMQEQILSRSSILPIINQYNLYASGNTSMDDRIDLTRKAIGIKPIPSGPSSRGMPGFYITFKAQDPQTAQKVCGDITSLFTAANLSAREESAEGTTAFLRQQLADSKRNLDEQDAKLAAFEQRNIGRLPQQEGANSNTLQALTAQLDASTQAVSRLQQDETFLDAMVTQQSSGATRIDPVTGAPESSLQAQLREAIAQEKQLETRYTADYPDVLAAKRRVASLQAEIAHEAAAPAKDPTSVSASDSPQLQQNKTQLRAAKQALATAKLEQARIQQQVRSYEAKIESSPMVEEEYKLITRDHETALSSITPC